VTLAAATAHQAFEHGAVMLRELGAANLAIGFGAAFLSAWLAVRGLVKLLERGGLAGFGVYRIALALIVAVLLWRGVLPS
jgi:undecaprenyl-diphosphatase